MTSHWETASLPIGKLHHFPLGSCITFHWKVESFLTSRQEAFSLPNRNLPHFPSSHREASSPLIGKFPHSHQEAFSLITAHREASFLTTGKLPPLLSGSCITFRQEASSLFKLIQAACIGDLLPKINFFRKKIEKNQFLKKKSRYASVPNEPTFER